jgi:hypothetical protein
MYHPNIDDGTPISLIREIIFDDHMKSNVNTNVKSNVNTNMNVNHVNMNVDDDVDDDDNDDHHMDNYVDIKQTKQNKQTNEPKQTINVNDDTKRSRLQSIRSIIYVFVFTFISFIGFYITPFIMKTKKFMNIQTNIIVSFIIGTILSWVIHLINNL